ncbi:hypothetical protein GCM10009527_027610 [Actinomadura nitritigenes]|uniref:50S ribosomal protein L11 methyltransferase n=1 Tax=Actinomadura nitritigenes TaxID=134602 RepID=A0ABS3RCN5_9ACTN|nr:50S ribosomal protein L11 methyltransferase [Actinomadura nitritigenes]MBO2443988.1 50S ribosomal protein L11 methyltransferase [Actinomadura nitritigenes]
MIRWGADVDIDSPDIAGAIARLVPCLREGGFDERSAARVLGARDIDDLLRRSALYALGSYGRVAELVRTSEGMLTHLFVRNGDVERHQYTSVLGRDLRVILETLDMVELGDRVRPTVSVSPHSGMYFLSDPLFSCVGERPVMNLNPDLVMPPHASSLVMRREVSGRGGRLLDVGTGSGFLALTMAADHESVTGIDINPRAVLFAKVNALVNGRAGDFRVAGFEDGLDGHDHVVFNAPGRPPRDRAGESGPFTAESIVRELGRTRLKAGALVQVLIIVPVPRGRPDIVAEWLDGRDHTVTEVDAPMFAIPATAIVKGRIPARCLLVDGPDDAGQVLRQLHGKGIDRVVPLLLSIRG